MSTTQTQQAEALVLARRVDARRRDNPNTSMHTSDIEVLAGEVIRLDAEVQRLKDVTYFDGKDSQSWYEEARRLREAGTTLAEFAQTAPGRLPSRVQDAIRALSGTPEDATASRLVARTPKELQIEEVLRDEETNADLAYRERAIEFARGVRQVIRSVREVLQPVGHVRASQPTPETARGE